MSRNRLALSAVSTLAAAMLLTQGADDTAALTASSQPEQLEVSIHLPLSLVGADVADLPAPETAVPGTATPTATDAQVEPSATSTPTVTSTDAPPDPSETPDPTPTWQPPAEGIFGKVTFGGSPDPGRTVELQRTAGGQAVLVAKTLTSAAGRYHFTDVPALQDGWVYGIRFANDSISDRLSLWFGPDIASFEQGDSVGGGDFDTADVGLASPEAGASLSLPSTFEWLDRGIDGDSYQWYMGDADSDDSWGTHPLGDVTSYTVSRFTPSVHYDRTYWWHVRVHAGGGYGLSHFQRSVSFEPPDHGIAGTITFRGTPEAGVRLLLLRLQGGSWTEIGHASTDADGVYDFDQAPSLPQNSQYHVKYENLDDPERLSLWLGPAITRYGRGEAADGGSFDIADVGLMAPSYGATAALPVTFEWGRRGLPEDDYEWLALDAQTGRTWTSDRLGDVGEFELRRLMTAMQYGTEYWWYVQVRSEDNGIGVAFMQFPITLQRSSAGELRGSVPAAIVDLPR